MKQDLSREGRPQPLRRTAARSFSLATKQQRFQEVEGRCEACGELIGDGTDWRRAIYHHRRLVSDPNVSDKEARSAANCMVLHRDCHDDPVEFYNLHGFYPEANSHAAGGSAAYCSLSSAGGSRVASKPAVFYGFMRMGEIKFQNAVMARGFQGPRQQPLCRLTDGQIRD